MSVLLSSNVVVIAMPFSVSFRYYQQVSVVVFFFILLAPNTSCELNISNHDGDSFGVNGCQIGIFEQMDEIIFSGFLKGHQGLACPAKFLAGTSEMVLGHLSHESGKRQFPQQQISRPLITLHHTKSLLYKQEI